MVADYRVLEKRDASEGTGYYEMTRIGIPMEIKKHEEEYHTPAGVFLSREWYRNVKEAIKEEGKQRLLSRIKFYCIGHFKELKTEYEIELFAMECLVNEHYKTWPGFGA